MGEQPLAYVVKMLRCVSLFIYNARMHAVWLLGTLGRVLCVLSGQNEYLSVFCLFEDPRHDPVFAGINHLWRDDGPMKWLMRTHIRIHVLCYIRYFALMLSQAWRRARFGDAARRALEALLVECRCRVHAFL